MSGREICVTRSDISKYHKKYLKKGTSWQPDVALIEKDGAEVVVKDYFNRGMLCRLMGYFAIRQECFIYAKLHDLKGIPDFFGKIDRYAFAIEHIDGKTSALFKKGDLPASFFEKAAKIVALVHQRNIVLCDMRNNKNIIVTDSFEPYLIDFATSFEKGSCINFLKNLLYKIFYQDDLHGILKLKSRLYPELLTEKEAEDYAKGLVFQQEAIWLRNNIRKHLKKLTIK